MDVICSRSLSLNGTKLTATTSAPTPTNTEPVAGDDGVYVVTEALNYSMSQGEGVAPKVAIVCGKTGATGTYAFRVYGWFKSGTGWVPILLYYATSVAADQSPGGTANADTFDTNDKVAGAITVNAATASGIHQTTSYASGPSHILLDTRGCPYLTFVSDDAAAFVLVRKAS